MPTNIETSRGVEELKNYTFNRQNDAALILHRILASQGVSIAIEDSYSREGEIVSTTVLATEETSERIYRLYDRLWNETRRGYAVWAADVGAIWILRDEIFHDQNNTGEDDARFATSRVDRSALEECYVLGYERVNGYRKPEANTEEGRNGNPIHHNYYASLKSKGVEPIRPEAMGILLHQAIQELAPAI